MVVDRSVCTFFHHAWYSEDGHSFVAEEPGKCWHCGELTMWIEVNFEAYLCLGKCNAAKWEELMRACLA